MMLPTSTASGSVHAKGIEDLLRLQTPDFYSSGIGHQLFVGFRPVLVKFLSWRYLLYRANADYVGTS
jgi:hypothetical protein